MDTYIFLYAVYGIPSFNLLDNKKNYNILVEQILQELRINSNKWISSKTYMNIATLISCSKEEVIEAWRTPLHIPDTVSCFEHGARLFFT